MGRREVVEKEEVVMVKHMQAELGAGLIFLCKLELTGLNWVSLTPIWSMTLSFQALTQGRFEWSSAIFEKDLNLIGVCQRVLASVESQSPLCILVFLTPWISSTLVRLCLGVLGWSGSW